MNVKPLENTVCPPLSRRRKRGRLLTGALLPHAWATTLSAALPVPLVDLKFPEASTATETANGGSPGGTAALTAPDGLPVIISSAPFGTFVPGSNTSSIDLGTIAANQGGRAVDLLPADENPTLGAMEAFTVCGWVNARQLNEGYGGNRIAFALAGPGGPGFDLVQLANGALRLGVNEWPDFPSQGPLSSPVVTADPEAGAANRVFFAVTYDSAAEFGHVTYHFGTPAQAGAAADITADYPQGAFASTGALTIGNLNTADGAGNATGANSRCFRGTAGRDTGA